MPVGVPPAAVPVTTALSKSSVPRATGLTSAVPLPSDGVVTVTVGICRTMKHSEFPLPKWTNFPGGSGGRYLAVAGPLGPEAVASGRERCCAALTAAEVALASPGGGAELASGTGLPTCVPSLPVVPSQRSVEPAANEHRKNVTFPVGVGGLATPEPSTVAMSVTGSPGETSPPAPTLGVVVIVAPHGWNWPRTKSFSCAFVEVEDRVSATKLEKHSLARLIDGSLRLIPASNSSPCRKAVLSSLSRKGHGRGSRRQSTRSRSRRTDPGWSRHTSGSRPPVTNWRLPVLSQVGPVPGAPQTHL